MRNAILGISALILAACGQTPAPVVPAAPRLVEAPMYKCLPLNVVQTVVREDLSSPRDGVQETVVDHCTNPRGDWYRFSIDGTQEMTWGYQQIPVTGYGGRFWIDLECSNEEQRFEAPYSALAIPQCWEEMGRMHRDLQGE